MEQNYSVLMSVYYKEKPEYLKAAIESMLNQTIPTNDFVLVCDGPLTPELDEVINQFYTKYPEIFQVHRLTKNQGLGNALNVGLKLCKDELVARMDSDDIALPQRCEIQLKMFSDNPDLAFCSGTIAEFEDSPDQIVSLRKLPCEFDKIKTFAKKRNPINHMAVMYRKSAVIAVGNYLDMQFAEDYFLWVRMLCNGYKAQNTNDILVYARIGNGMYKRRGGILYAKCIYALQKSFLQLKFISRLEFLQNCIIRISASLIPTSIRKSIYQSRLRKHM